MKIRCLLISVLGILNAAIGVAQPSLNTLDKRKAFLIDSMASWARNLNMNDYEEADGYGGGKYGAYPAMALFEKGEIEKAQDMAARQLVGGAAMFREFGTMSLYMTYHHLYSEELKQKVKENQLHSNFFNAEPNFDPNDPAQSHRNSMLGGASENHKLMYAAAAYMAGIAWPEEYPAQWYKAGYDHLMNWFHTLTDFGFWEEDSPTYLIHHMGPLLSVYEAAPEGSKMKKRAKMVLDWYFASVAGEYLKGYWITPAARDYNPLYGVEKSAETTALMWLFFNDTDQVPYPHVHTTMYHWKAAIHFAVSDYDVPAIIRKIATKRDQPYVHKEYMQKNPMKPKEYCYITPSYGVASVQHETGVPPDDMTRWKVQWIPVNSNMEPTTFLLKHPVRNQQWKKWRGASEFEQTIQDRGTLLAVYNIPKKEKGFIDGPFNPNAYKLVIEKKGWMFFHTGNMLMAVAAANGLKIARYKRTPGHTDLTGIKAIRSNGRKNALVVHTEKAGKYNGDTAQQMEEFMQDIFRNSLVDFSHVQSPQPEVSFVTPDKEKLSIQFNGEKIINGNVLDPENYPLFENPWMLQQQGKRILTLRYNNELLVYDFNKWEVIHKNSKN